MHMKQSIRSLGFALAGLAVLTMSPSLAAKAQTAPNSGLTVSGAWARETFSATSSAVVYLSVTDTGAPDRLTGVSTPVAGMAGLHQSKMVNGVMQMRPVAALTVKPGEPLHLQPNGYHVMLTNLKQKLSAGSSFPLTLSFEHAGKITTTVAVHPLHDPAMKTGHNMDMGKGMDMGTMKH